MKAADASCGPHAGANHHPCVVSGVVSLRDVRATAAGGNCGGYAINEAGDLRASLDPPNGDTGNGLSLAPEMQIAYSGWRMRVVRIDARQSGHSPNSSL